MTHPPTEGYPPVYEVSTPPLPRDTSCNHTTLQIEREVEEEAEGPTFKENKNPISPATGNEEKKERNQEENIAADTVKYSQRLLQKKEALLKRIAKLQKQCEE